MITKEKEKKNNKIAKKKDFEKIIKLLKNKNPETIFSGEDLESVLNNQYTKNEEGKKCEEFSWLVPFNAEILNDNRDCDYFYYDKSAFAGELDSYSKVKPLRNTRDLWETFLSDMLDLGYVRVANEDDFREILNNFKHYKEIINSRVDIAEYIRKMLIKGFEVTHIVDVLKKNKDCNYFYMNMEDITRKNHMKNSQYLSNTPKPIKNLKDLFDEMSESIKAIGWVENTQSIK